MEQVVHSLVNVCIKHQGKKHALLWRQSAFVGVCAVIPKLIYSFHACIYV